ncbi:hypothetical protein NQ317_012630 [Molorchus minor]|uniref:Uncharacterized protein n=1 Tax=Molorchus minor TaxID=1323400 RepID=A0ABQ9J5V4_9CUCU|nr:hypothetical protein NQ317_012630 [Molorchus minor]
MRAEKGLHTRAVDMLLRWQESLTYQPLLNGAVIKNYGNGEVLSTERQAGPGRPELKVRDECDNREGYAESGYVTVMGAEVPQQSVRCDSVRSEAAESSCSSLSSADEGLVVVQNQPPPEMVVYDPSVSVRPSGVVLTVGSPTPMIQHTQNNSSPLVGTLNMSQQSFVSVPYGWKRMLSNGSIIYIRLDRIPNATRTDERTDDPHLRHPDFCQVC